MSLSSVVYEQVTTIYNVSLSSVAYGQVTAIYNVSLSSVAYGQVTTIYNMSLSSVAYGQVTTIYPQALWRILENLLFMLRDKSSVATINIYLSSTSGVFITFKLYTFS